MYKKIMLVVSIVAGLTSCNGDYTDWVLPTQNVQQELKTVTLEATPAAELIDLDLVADEYVQVVEFTNMPSVRSFTATYNLVNGENTVNLAVDSLGMVSVKDLKEAIAKLYGRDRVVRTLTGKISAVAKTDSTDVQASTTIRLETANAISFKAEYPNQASYYFITGTPNGAWTDKADDLHVPFIPTLDNKNFQTVTTYFTGDSDMKFWLQDEIGDWSKCYGSKVDKAKDPTGELVNTNAGAFASPEAGFYTLKIDMVNNTYTFVMCDEQFPAEYNAIGLVGVDDNWNDDINLTQVVSTCGEKTHLWYAKNVVVTTCPWGVKFRVDHAWSTSWGKSDDFPYGTCGTGSGDNISGVVPGTYDVYFNDITKQYLFITK